MSLTRRRSTYLVLINQIELIPQLFDQLIVPSAVIEELRHPKAPATVATWVRNLPTWVIIRDPIVQLSLPDGLGRGECAAISLAVELETAILADDKAARNSATSYGCVVFGTIGLLDLADELGLLDFEEALTLLESTTFHVEDEVVEVIRAQVRARKKIQ